jgi:hypothetical protein
MYEKWVVDQDKVERIKTLCKRLIGSRDVDKILPELRRFVAQEIKAGRGELFNKYKDFNPDKSTVRRAFDPDKGCPTYKTYLYLEEIIDLYLAKYEAASVDVVVGGGNRPAFSEKAADDLRHSANDFCSYYDCDNLTGGSSLHNPNEPSNLGEACLIYGLHPGDMRYDPAVHYEYDDISNGIWLCVLHATLVNMHEGDYSALTLMEWKHTHTDFVNDIKAGKIKMHFSMNGNKSDRPSAIRLLAYFKTLPHLQEGLAGPSGAAVIGMADQIDVMLRDMTFTISPGGMLGGQLVVIHHMTNVLRQKIKAGSPVAIVLAIWKKMLRRELMEIADYYSC